MLHLLAERFPYAPWSLFQYITFRSAGAAVTSLLLSWWLGPWMIGRLRALKLRQEYSDKAEAASAAHANTGKRGTPTMGGLLVILVVDLSVLLWSRWNTLVLLTILTMVVLAALGFYDDWLKVSKQSSAGARSHLKLVIQAALAIAIATYLWQLPALKRLVVDVNLPFVPKKFAILHGLPWLGVLVLICTIVGSSNAVNLTDGMDGLAIGCTLIVAMVMLLLTYLADNVKFATYLGIPHVRGASELTVVCAALIGASLGFLWFNCHPAQVFMGDTGSLALGGALGVMAVLIHQPFTLLIAGGVFVAEALSVMLQVGWFKYTRHRFGAGRRIFRMSPLHHHFRELGWAESKIVTRFYIVCILCAVAALSTLKLR